MTNIERIIADRNAILDAPTAPEKAEPMYTATTVGGQPWPSPPEPVKPPATPAGSVEDDRATLAYHDLCREIATECGGKLYGSNLNDGFSYTVPHTNVHEDIPHAIVEMISRLRAECDRLRAENQTMRDQLQGKDDAIAELRSDRENALSALGDHPDSTIDLAARIGEIRDEGRAHFHSLTRMGEKLATVTAERDRYRKYLIRMIISDGGESTLRSLAREALTPDAAKGTEEKP